MDTNDVRSGKLVSIEANKLEDGSAIDISNDGSSLSTGSLIKLSSKSTNVTNGILRMDTNDVRSGKLVSIEANKLEDGSAIDISNDGSSLSTGSLIKLSSKSTNVTNGILRILMIYVVVSLYLLKLINSKMDSIDISNDGSSLWIIDTILKIYQRHQRYITYGY